jgi:hypothetical protein
MNCTRRNTSGPLAVKELIARRSVSTASMCWPAFALASASRAKSSISPARASPAEPIKATAMIFSLIMISPLTASAPLFPLGGSFAGLRGRRVPSGFVLGATDLVLPQPRVGADRMA